MIYPLEVPAAATVIGQLYGPEHAEELGEDMLLVMLGGYGIDVRWWPSYAADGQYAVREFKNEWSNRIGGFLTRDPLEVQSIINHRFSELCSDAKEVSRQDVSEFAAVSMRLRHYPQSEQGLIAHESCSGEPVSKKDPLFPHRNKCSSFVVNLVMDSGAEVIALPGMVSGEQSERGQILRMAVSGSWTDAKVFRPHGIVLQQAHLPPSVFIRDEFVQKASGKGKSLGSVRNDTEHRIYTGQV